MARLELTLLGGFQARLNPGPRLRVPTRKAQGLLAYLAVPCGLAHPRDKLASLLWGEMPQGQARTNLRQTLFSLRKALPVTAPDSLHLESALVALDPAAIDVDVAAFETQVARGTPEALTRAAALYQGDLLEGLAVHEAPFEDWLMTERERLRELALEGLAKLLGQQRAVGETEAALRTAGRLIALDPLLETVHRTLMRLYVELGRRAAALRQYQFCVGLLERELGVEPEAETRQLYQTILHAEGDGHGNTPPSPASGAGRAAPIPSLATPAPVAAATRCDQTAAERRRLEPIGHLTGTGHRVVDGERGSFGGHERLLTPLVGRERDLDMLTERLHRAEAGEAQSVSLVGEPGVGKSRLVHEFASRLEPGRITYLEGRCVSQGDAMPYLTIVELLRALFGVVEAEPRTATVAKLGAGLRRLDLDPDESIAYLLHILGFREGTDKLLPPNPNVVRDRALDTITHVLQAESRRRPLLIVVEDLHWIDPTSREALAFLADDLVGYPLMLLATYRPAHRPSWVDGSRISQLAVSRLTRADSLTVVRSVRPDLPSHLAELIATHGDGVPFFLEELAWLVSDLDVESDVRMADTLEAVLLARLHRLGPDERQVLETAAVIGESVPLPVLEAATDMPRDRLYEHLRRLQDAAFIDQSRVAPTTAHRFRHALTHDVTYRSIPEQRRREQHARVARAIEMLLPDTCECRPELLARHYTLAAQRQPAIDYWHRAAQRALERGAYAEAVAHVRSGLELLEPRPEILEPAPRTDAAGRHCTGEGFG